MTSVTVVAWMMAGGGLLLVALSGRFFIENRLLAERASVTFLTASGGRSALRGAN